MSFRKFLATAALAVAATVAPASAYEEGSAQLFNVLEQAGVEVTSGDCEPHGITDTYGFFMPAKNWIHICTDVATTDEQKYETLRHESVHAAQFCVDPSMASTVLSHQWIDENYSKSDWAFIKQAYDKSDWLIEIEAFTLMKYSNYQVAKLVNTACNWGSCRLTPAVSFVVL